MTREEIEEIYEFAFKSGLAPDLVYKDGDEYSDRFENFKAFAFYVREKEREACAKVCDGYSDGRHANMADLCAEAIRARGEQE